MSAQGLEKSTSSHQIPENKENEYSENKYAPMNLQNQASKTSKQFLPHAAQSDPEPKLSNTVSNQGTTSATSSSKPKKSRPLTSKGKRQQPNPSTSPYLKPSLPVTIKEQTIVKVREFVN